MPELDDQLRGYIDGVAPAITLAEVTDRGDHDTVVATIGHRRPWRALIAVAACVALVSGIVLVARAPHDDDQVGTGPGTTAGAVGPTAWLTPFGPEKPEPLVPAGWKVLDFGAMRFAVPARWDTPVFRSCSPDPDVGVVMVWDHAESSTCNPVPPLPVSSLVVEPATTPAGRGTPTMVGTFHAETTVAPTCLGCLATYRLDNGYQVSVSGPDAGRVLATFTDSGTHRVLQTGPAADTSEWRTVTFEGISFDTPPTWPTTDVAAHNTRTTNPAGTIVQESGDANPGTCSGLFTGQPGVFLGLSMRSVSSCFALTATDLEPRDGAWIRAWTTAVEPSSSTLLAQGRLHGLDVSIMETDRTPPEPPLLEIEIHGTNPLQLTLGVGIDPSTARTVLRSIRPA